MRLHSAHTTISRMTSMILWTQRQRAYPSVTGIMQVRNRETFLSAEKSVRRGKRETANMKKFKGA